MTAFDRSKFSYHGGYLTYAGKFVARFKYANPSASAGTFRTFLIKNFTVEEYFDRYTAGEAPLCILESKGYLLPHITKELRRAGLPLTREGFRAYVAQTMLTRAARVGGVA